MYRAICQILSISCHHLWVV